MEVAMDFYILGDSFPLIEFLWYLDQSEEALEYCVVDRPMLNKIIYHVEDISLRMKKFNTKKDVPIEIQSSQ